jgi:hypothetical protein
MDEKLSLLNLANGAAVEVFDRELDQVIRNIADVNTDAEAKRQITLEVRFMPFEDRSGSQIEITCKAKLIGVPGVKTQAFIRKSGSQVTAYSHDPRQTRLFEDPAPERPQ